MAKKIEIRDRGVTIGSVTEGGIWTDAAGKRSNDFLLVGKTYEQINSLFLKRSQHRPPSQSEGRMYQDEYSFHFSG
ncbi:hypothetical protein ACXR2T_09950 [Leucobacter sp. HY1910]